MLASPSTSNAFEDLTGYCKATADQQRLLILRVLSRESFGVLELCHILEVAQPALSHHLKVLHTAGLVETRRQGNSIFYRRATIPTTDPFAGIRHSLHITLDQFDLPDKTAQRVKEIYRNRHEQARLFFEKNAHRFQENQNLIAEYPNYASCVNDLLDNTSVSGRSQIVEIGPGESELIFDLAARAGRVTAIDNSEDMLAKARAKLASVKFNNVEYLLGEINDNQEPADLVVANMVLHHMASPSQFFQEAYRHIKPNGFLLIADLCAHDQDWTRDACGDLWLGFEPDELDRWALNAGFEVGQSAYVGMKNGFQVQVRLFLKKTISKTTTSKTTTSKTTKHTN